MFIEIRGAGFVNKGAELMIYAIMSKVQARYPDAKFVISPSATSYYEKRAHVGMYQKLTYRKFGIEWGSMVSKKRRKMYGLILDREIDVVLDASGFAHGDQWSPTNSSKLAALSHRWKQQKTKLILLPQAFGPFSNPKTKPSMVQIVKNATLVFAREKKSYDYLSNVVGNQNNIEQYGDFTNLIKGIVPDSFDSANANICIIPNFKMIAQTSKSEGESYVPFLSKCIEYIASKGKHPFILIHEGDKDLELAKAVVKTTHSIPIICETNALKIKGIIGACDAVIGSRFHGLVSALSQAVPVLGTGWSHKYRMLFEDYDYSDGLCRVTMTDSELFAKLDMILDQDSSAKIKDRLHAKSELLKLKSEEMWEKIFDRIDA